MEDKQVNNQAQRHDYTKEIIGRRNYHPVTSEQSKSKRQLKVGFRLKKIGLVATIVIIASAFVLLYLHSKSSSSPLPENIRQTISFPVYLPDQKKLPTGYQFDKSSFSTPEAGVLLYKLNRRSSSKPLFISNQKKPADNIINNFYSKYIPLRNEVKIPLGTVQVGAFSDSGQIKTLASLTIDKDNIWLIITAPSDTKPNELKQVLLSLKKS